MSPTRTTIRELHEKTGQIVERASRGDIIIVLKNGTPVAELRPLSRAQVSLPNREKLLATFPKLDTNSGQILEEDRR